MANIEFQWHIAEDDNHWHALTHELQSIPLETDNKPAKSHKWFWLTFISTSLVLYILSNPALYRDNSQPAYMFPDTPTPYKYSNPIHVLPNKTPQASSHTDFKHCQNLLNPRYCYQKAISAAATLQAAPSLTPDYTPILIPTSTNSK